MAVETLRFKYILFTRKLDYPGLLASLWGKIFHSVSSRICLYYSVDQIRAFVFVVVFVVASTGISNCI